LAYVKGELGDASADAGHYVNLVFGFERASELNLFSNLARSDFVGLYDLGASSSSATGATAAGAAALSSLSAGASLSLSALCLSARAALSGSAALLQFRVGAYFFTDAVTDKAQQAEQWQNPQEMFNACPHCHINLRILIRRRCWQRVYFQTKSQS
jgi:hypothetical protein